MGERRRVIGGLFMAGGKARHLVVCHHGWRSCGNWDFVSTGVERGLQQQGYRVLVVHCNDGNLSDDGVEICAQRAVEEVRSVVTQERLESISLVGFSFGGLVVRYMAALMYTELKGQPRIAGLTPHVLMTCGSPHAGVAGTLNSVYTAVLRMVG